MKLKHLSLTVMAMGATVVSAGAFASGYQFGSQSVSAQGTAFANGAEAADASVLFYNPAGMSHLKGTNLSAGVTLLMPHSEFTNNGSTNVLHQSTGTNNGGDFAPSMVAAPSFYLTHEINDRLSAGIGVFVPYGAKLDYDSNWAGRYSLQNVSLQTIDINPSISYKLSDKHSIGFGISAQYMDGKLNQAADTKSGAYIATLARTGSPATAAAVASGVNGDGQGRVSVNSWGFGWNVGYMYDLSDATRFGLAYRSSVKQKLEGTWIWDFSNVSGNVPFGPGGAMIPMQAVAKAQHPSSNASLDVDTPETVSANVFHQLNDKIALMGDVTWTRNSRLQEIRIKQDNGNGDLVMHQNWRDTYRFSVGMNYKFSDAFLLRTGIAFDQSPVPDAQNRHPALPDSDRTLFSLGGNYKLNKNSSIDVAYTYMHFADADINYTDTCTPVGVSASGASCTGNGENTKGSYKSYIQMVGLQYNYKF
jgi:long-chain fatty acid transport protein